MKTRTLALATFVALFGAGASFSSLANDPPSDEVNPVQEPTPASGAALDQDDPAVASDEIFDDDESLASDDDDTDAAASDAMSEADASDASMSETTASTTIAPAPAATGAQVPRAPSDVARMDSDGNGTLEIAEVSDKSELKLRFAEFDLDQDGSLSANEFASWLGPDHATTGIAATATTTTTTDSTVLSTDTDIEVTDTDALTAQTAEEADETESEDVGGEANRPSDAGTPDVDSDEEEALDPDDNDD